ncbi:unnamed protein product [Schistosoma guineensis]|uniref:Eukaryotic translation initiation factor 5A n=4 Tax=Schistosoma TaxID=6181 RepID=A0A183PI64_9TREM|nr:Eukaryotic translation initiation factor 5A-1 [Schistosoma haematobium]CAH8493910.1 unnamed protein product [Schistosoma mattheei]CAH8499360.1 unnamed protein product [Schistosoma guineensis]CAH8502363.1 unnamed protein product [Schistosoma bovis]CAH8505436.1 unnamed protein product [Schistosoma curassoni]KAH9584719.1 Eukaryotic translation initiation factor 5A-1 [Schistosoma haematobium]
MSIVDDEEFATGDSGASKTLPKQCSSLRKGGYVVMKDRPCKIVDMSTSKTGKHGSAKVHIVGIDIFTGKKYEENRTSSHTMDVPVIKSEDYQLVDIKDGFLSLMGDDLCVIEDIPVPDNEVGKELKEKWNSRGETENMIVTILSAMDERQALKVRTTSDK